LFKESYLNLVLRMMPVDIVLEGLKVWKGMRKFVLKFVKMKSCAAEQAGAVEIRGLRPLIGLVCPGTEP
jgi:hypothetical protein